jgi:hypothetical protein
MSEILNLTNMFTSERESYIAACFVLKTEHTAELQRCYWSRREQSSKTMKIKEFLCILKNTRPLTIIFKTVQQDIVLH